MNNDTMVDKVKESKSLVLIITVILMIQCAVLVFWQEQRGNYFLDELFSFGFANSFTAESSYYIRESEAWKYDTWMNSEDLISQLEVNDNNSILSLPVGEQIRLLTSKRTYMGLLNIAMSYSKPFEGYSRGALVLNMIFLLLSELLFCILIRTLTRSRKIMVLSLIMFGFSAIIIGMCEYIRFYILSIMLLLIVLFCHLKLWKHNRIWTFLIIELIAFISAYYGVMHSELMFPICGSLFCFFFLSLLCRRQFLNATVYAVPLLLGAYTYIYKRTTLFDILLHPSKYADPSAWGIGHTTYNVLTVTPERAENCLGLIKDVLLDRWFGSGFIVLAFLILFIAWMVLIIINRSQSESETKEPDKYTGFIIVLALTVITYVTFIVLSNIPGDRYLSFAIVMMMIVFWYCIGLLHREYPCRSLLACFAVVVIAGGIMCQQGDRFPYLYVDDSAGTAAAKEYQMLDNVIVENYSSGTENHAVYDCIAHSGRDVRILATKPDRKDTLDADDLPEQFLVWCSINGGEDKMHALLDEEEYTAKKLGATHINEIYLCSRKQ